MKVYLTDLACNHNTDWTVKDQIILKTTWIYLGKFIIHPSFKYRSKLFQCSMSSYRRGEGHRLIKKLYLPFFWLQMFRSIPKLLKRFEKVKNCACSLSSMSMFQHIEDRDSADTEKSFHIANFRKLYILLSSLFNSIIFIFLM